MATVTPARGPRAWPTPAPPPPCPLRAATRHSLLPLSLALFLLPAPSVHAHLNHLQLAQISEAGGKLVIQYRVSQDMVVSSLAWAIENGSLKPKARHWPIEEQLQALVAAAWSLSSGAWQAAPSLAGLERDPQSGDWIARLEARLPKGLQTLTLRCSAFLEANPKTATLARIDWGGNQLIHHFRSGQTACTLTRTAASAMDPADPVDPAGSRRTPGSGPWERFLATPTYAGLQRACNAYLALLALACVALAARRMRSFLHGLLAFLAGIALGPALAATGIPSVASGPWAAARGLGLLLAVSLPFLDARLLNAPPERWRPALLALPALLLGLLQGALFLLPDTTLGPAPWPAEFGHPQARGDGFGGPEAVWSGIEFGLAVLLALNAWALTIFFLGCRLRRGRSPERSGAASQSRLPHPARAFPGPWVAAFWLLALVSGLLAFGPLGGEASRPPPSRNAFVERHRIAYDVYAARNPEEAYDLLALAFQGRELARQFADYAQGRAQTRKAGAGVMVWDLLYRDYEVLESQGARCRVRATWNVVFLLGHTQHTHVRSTAYRAIFELAWQEGHWRIVRSTLLPQAQAAAS